MHEHAHPLSTHIHGNAIFGHLRALESIALAHPSGSRSVRNAYNASAHYVMDALRGFDCAMSTQSFVVPVWEEYAPSVLKARRATQRSGSATATAMQQSDAPLSQRTGAASDAIINFQHGVDYRAMRYGGRRSANLSAVPLAVVTTANPCDAEAYKSVRSGAAILILADLPAMTTHGCSIWDAAILAQNTGRAAAVFFYNTLARTSLLGNRVRIVNWRGGDALMEVPVLSLSHSVGMALVEGARAGMTVDLATSMDIHIVPTFNVVCETREGDPENVVMVGAHLDSVPEGRRSGAISCVGLVIDMCDHHCSTSTYLI